jgi:DNA adenine methylase
MLSFIKWTGSKRSQADWIVSKIPNFTGKYIEMFLGSGIVLLTYLKEYPNAKCLGNDLCYPLICLWEKCRDNPKELMTDYKDMWNQFNSKDIDYRKTYFNQIRKEFNDDKSKSSHFLFLTRTSTNGLVRFNSKGNYNATPHFSRPGINPNELNDIITECSQLIQNVEFTNKSYDELDISENDFCYMDPPYALTTNNMYMGGIDNEKYYEYVRKMPCKWLMSYDGLVNGQTIYELPKDIYKNKYLSKMVLSTSQNTNYGNTKGKRYVQESLYSNYNEINIDCF